MNEAIRKQLNKAKTEARREGHRKNLHLHLDRYGLPHPTEEFQFEPTRKWRIDFAWWFCSLRTRKEVKIALEVEGGIYNAKGGHHSITGFLQGVTKYNELTIQGWQLIRVIPEQIDQRHEEGITWIRRILKQHW